MLTGRNSNKKSFSISDWRWMSIELEKGEMKSSDDEDEVPDDCSQDLHLSYLCHNAVAPMNLQTSQYLLPPFISYIETAQPLALPLYLLRLLQNLNYSGHLPLSYFRLHYSICLHLLSCPHPHLKTIAFLLRGNHLKAIAST